MDLRRLRAAVARFRAAIEDSRDLESEGLRGFPRGACGDVTRLLGEYLSESGFGEWSYIAGIMPPDNWSHAWLEHDDVVIDITADQFDNVIDRVIVTRDSPWHRQFSRVSSPRPADLNIDGVGVDALRRDYARLRARSSSGDRSHHPAPGPLDALPVGLGPSSCG